MSNKKTLSDKELILLGKLNARALMLHRIEEYFRSKKIPIDPEYLDGLSDEKIDEIYKTHCNGE
jgi:hypothetical protein